VGLDALVEAGEREPLVVWLEGLGPTGRRGLARQAKTLFATVNRFDGGTRDVAAAAAAWLAVYAADAPGAARWAALAPEPAELVAITRRLDPPGLGAFVAKILPRFWRAAAALVEAGLAPRPAERLWALGMMGVPNNWTRSPFEAWEAVLLRDVALLFAHEGEGEFSLSAFSGRMWHDHLLGWVASGTLPRGRALDLGLQALLSGFAPGRQPFFTGLLDALAPSEAEWTARRDPLVRLLASAASATVSWAMRQLEGPLARDEIPAVALEGAVQARSLQTARAALAAVARRAEPDAARVAALGLGHPELRVQSDAAAILLKRCPPAELSLAVAPWRDGLHAKVRALLGEPVAATTPAAPAARVDPLSPDRRLPAFTGDDHALLDAVAAWVESPIDIDLGEVLLAALATRPRSATIREHGAALARTWKRRPRAGPGGLLAMVACAWALGESPGEPDLPVGWSTGSLYAARAVALAQALAAGEPVAWLSLPTHRGGHLAADEALRRWNSREGKVLTGDLALAWSRLSGPRPPPPAGAGDPLTAGWRHVLGGPAAALPLPLAVAAAHARIPPGELLALDGRTWRTRVGEPRRFDRTWSDGHVTALVDVGGDFIADPMWWDRPPPVPADLLAARALVPGTSGDAVPPGCAAHDRAAIPDRPSEWHARALHDLLRWLASSEVDTRRPDVVAVLIDDATPLGAGGHRVLAAALTSAHGSVRVAGVDLALAAIADGRLEPRLLGEALGWLLAGDLLPAGRAVTSLTAVISAGFPGVVRDLWLAALAPLGPVRDLTRVLEQLEAAWLIDPAPLSAASRDALAGISGGRAARIARGILRR
jgi:hypothetical protein